MFFQTYAPPGTYALGLCFIGGDWISICHGGDGFGTCGTATCDPTEVCVVDEAAVLPSGEIIDAGAAGGSLTPHCVPACWPVLPPA
jgi:hypothetical protein